MEDEKRKEIETLVKNEFEAKVMACMGAIESTDDEYLELMFQPTVIFEVCQRVFDDVIRTSRNNEQLLGFKIAAIDGHVRENRNRQFKDISFLFSSIKNDLRTSSILPFQALSTPKDLLNTNEFKKLIGSTERRILEMFDSTNHVIAIKAI